MERLRPLSSDKPYGEGLDLNLAFDLLPKNKDASIRLGGGLHGYRGNNDGLSQNFATLSNASSQQPDRVLGYSLMASTQFKTGAGEFDFAAESRNNIPYFSNGDKGAEVETNYFAAGYDPIKSSAVDMRLGGSLVTGPNSNPEHARGILHAGPDATFAFNIGKENNFQIKGTVAHDFVTDQATAKVGIGYRF